MICVQKLFCRVKFGFNPTTFFYIKFFRRCKLSSMIVLTATLLFLTLIFAPIYLKADVCLFVKDASARIKIGVGAVKVFDETISLASGKLHCEGTVTTDVELKSIDKKSSVDLLKCITVEKLYLTVYNNFARLSCLTLAFQNAFLALATATVCNMFHCQCCTQSLGTLREDCVRLRAMINFSVAELSFCLLKQGVRKWTHK